MRGSVDDRLIPINGLIALLRGEGGWPGLLGEQGFRRHQLEFPLSTPVGDIRADGLLYRCDPDLVLLAECKSGRNVEEKQARRYLAVDVNWLRRSGGIPPSLRDSGDVLVQTLFVGREEFRADLEAAQQQLGLVAPLLTVGADRVRLSGASATPGLDDFDVHHRGGLPPARLPVDHQSPDEAVLEALLPQIVAAQARAEDIVGVESICERILPEWSILAHSGRSDFIRRIEALVRRLALGEMRGQFRYEPAGPQVRGRVVIESTPATRDPRGRTQAWQAQQRRAGAALRRRGAREIPGQMSIDDLADQGGLAED